MYYIFAIFLVATVAALVIGLISFSKGTESGTKRSNNMMRARIVFQFLALVVGLIILLLMSK